MAQAFNIAYEKWEAHKKKKEERKSKQQAAVAKAPEPNHQADISLGKYK